MTTNCCEVIVAILLPPLAVGMRTGCCSGTFCLNLLLTLLFYFPGLIHAIIVITDPTTRRAYANAQPPTQIIVQQPATANGVPPVQQQPQMPAYQAPPPYNPQMYPPPK